MSEKLPPHLKRSVTLQRLSLRWESLWHAVQYPLIIAGLCLALLWSGLTAYLPRPFPAILLGLLVLTFLFSLRGLLRLRPLPDHVVLRKLDTVNALPNREASSLDDALAPESENAGDIWQEHLRRKLAALSRLRVEPPSSIWRGFDPLALRLPVVMAAVAAFLLGSGSLLSNLQNAAVIAAPPPPKPVVLDAWLKPPTYTGKPPLLLSSPAMVEKLKADNELTVPEGSVLNLHVTGATKPDIAFLSPGESEAPVKLDDAKIEKNETGLTGDVTLNRPVTVRVSDGGDELATYHISTITDEAPKIEILDQPVASDHGKLSVKWHASDDYGLKSVTAEIGLADEQEGGVTGFDNNGVFLYDPPDFKIALKKANAKDDTETSTGDLTSHAWAGLYAEITLTATDAAGHKTTTEPKRFKLPEREFIKPLAKALVEQRKKIIMDPQMAPDASTMIDTMLLYPSDIASNSGLIINLAAVNTTLANAGATDDVVEVVKDMWPLILAVENGQLDDARAELKSLAEELKQALRDGSSQEKIDELTRRMRGAMNRLLDKLQKEGQSRAAQGLKQQNQGPSVSQDQLQQMLDQMSKLNKDGNKDAAQDMLSQLDQMLQNLEPGQGQQAQNGQNGQRDDMNALSQMMRKQRKLMDETQRMNGDGEGKDDTSNGGIADKQKELRDQLGKLGQGMTGDEGSDKLGEAGKNMEGAEQALRDGDKQGALQQQNQALRNMMQGMGKLAQQMDKQGQGNLGQRGDRGDGTEDPLGRPRATTNPGVGPDRNLVPSELAMRRAREILEELRSRANEEGLDDDTKAYIDRLLKDQF